MTIQNINKCKTKKKNNKYNIKCKDYEIDIYYSKLLHKYQKSIVKYNNYTYTYTKNNLIIKLIGSFSLSLV